MWAARLTNIMGWLLLLLALSQLAPLIAAIVFAEDGMREAFAASAGASAFIGASLILSFRGFVSLDDKHIHYLAPLLGWVILPVFAAFPFMFFEQYQDFANAYFEAVSGLTGTGASVIEDPSALPHALLLWRSILEWIGGIGIISTAFILYPYLNFGTAQVVRRAMPTGESRSNPMEYLNGIKLLIPIYAGLSVACALFLWLSGEGAFDSLSLALSTISTGGFTHHPGAVAIEGNSAAESVLAAFMIFGSLNMLLFWHLIRPHYKHPGRHKETKYFLYMLMVATAALLIVVLTGSPELQGENQGILSALRKSIFLVASSLSTTGFNLEGSAFLVPLPLFAAFLLLALTFAGGCAGTTTGGFKIIRVIVLFRHAAQELKRLAHPHGATPVQFEGQVVKDQEIQAVWLLFFTFLLAILISMLVFSFLGLPFYSSLSLSLTSLTNAGPVMYMADPGFIGFGMLGIWEKCMVIGLMIFGRLEAVFALAILSKGFWR